MCVCVYMRDNLYNSTVHTCRVSSRILGLGGSSQELLSNTHASSRGVWGHAPAENFCIFNCLRLFLVQSETFAEDKY